MKLFGKPVVETKLNPAPGKIKIVFGPYEDLGQWEPTLVTDEITDLEYQPADAGVYNVRFTGRYRGVRVYSLAHVSPELEADVPALEAFMKRVLLEWAHEHWPPAANLPLTL